MLFTKQTSSLFHKNQQKQNGGWRRRREHINKSTSHNRHFLSDVYIWGQKTFPHTSIYHSMSTWVQFPTYEKLWGGWCVFSSHLSIHATVIWRTVEGYWLWLHRSGLGLMKTSRPKILSLGICQQKHPLWAHNWHPIAASAVRGKAPNLIVTKRS